MRILAFWSIILATFLAVGGIVLALAGFINAKNIAMGVGGIALIVVPLGAAIILWRIASQQGRPAFDAAVRAISGESNWYEASGIALDRRAGTVILAEAKSLRTVPAGSITEITYVPQRIAAGGSTQGILAIITVFRQASAALHNFSKAGLFVAADGRRSRVIGLRPADGDRWKALLAQAKAGA